jgi:hypothetical protein
MTSVWRQCHMTSGTKKTIKHILPIPRDLFPEIGHNSKPQCPQCRELVKEQSILIDSFIFVHIYIDIGKLCGVLARRNSTVCSYNLCSSSVCNIVFITTAVEKFILWMALALPSLQQHLAIKKDSLFSLQKTVIARIIGRKTPSSTVDNIFQF